MLSAVRVIAEKIVGEKKRNNGRAPWGLASQLLKQGKETFPNLSMRTINNYVIKIEEDVNNTVVKCTILLRSNASTLSTLTDPLTNNAPSNINTSSGNGASLNETLNVANEDASINNGVGRRPKGTTAHLQLDLRHRIEAATRDATDELEIVQNNEKAKGFLNNIINECKSQHSLDDSIQINEDTARQRVKRKSNSGTVGPKTPLLQIETYVLSLIIQLANMRVPITSAQGLQLCNSIIKGTKFEKTIAEYKKRSCRMVSMELGPGYWRGFMKQNGHLVRAKKAVKFDTKRSEWCSYANMEEMYNKEHNSLVTAGLAVKHDEPVWRSAASNIVPEEIMFGCKSTFELIHPEWLVFVNEVGSNTSQTKDGNIGGQTYLCTKEGLYMKCTGRYTLVSILPEFFLN
jgi:hypothetical protein